MHGLSRGELADWLLGAWREDGPSIALVEGFSGIGKSELARQVLRAWGAPKAMLSVSADAPDLDSVLFDLAAQLESSGCRVLADQAGGDYRVGLLDLLREDALIIVDDFNELLEPGSRAADPTFIDLASQINNRRGLGRVLLLSDQSPKPDAWLDDIAIKTMAPPAMAAAELVLYKMLKSRGLEDEVSTESITGVVQWLGRNPRAMQAFVACLRDEPLEELIELDADAWDIKDETVSAGLVAGLERRFLAKTIGRLDPNTLVAMESIAVHRKPFTVEALLSAMPKGVHGERAKDDLASRFLLTRDRRWYQLNPVARQMALSALSKEARRRTGAHHRAADYFLKRTNFDRPQDQARAGADFVEARYHLLMSNRGSDYQDLAARYRRLILKNYRNLNAMPASELARENLLRTLVAVLDDDLGGYGRVRGLLARLLVERDSPGDRERALRQVTVATRESRDVGDWLLRAELTAQFETTRSLSSVANQALEALASQPAVRVGYRAVELLAELGAEDLALQIIDTYITNCAKQHTRPLYTAAGYVLQRVGRTREAIDFLQKGYQVLGSKISQSYRLFEQALFLAYQIQDRGRIESVRQMILADSLNPYQSLLCDVLSLQLAGRYESALALGEKCDEYFAVAAQAAFCALVEGDPGRADEILSSAQFKSNSANVWLRGLVALCQGSAEVYEECMKESGASDIEGFEPGRPTAWFEVWNMAPNRVGIYPAFYFPVLPTGLTGLDFDVRKHGQDSVGLSQVDRARLRLPIGEFSPGVKVPSPQTALPINLKVEVNNYQEGQSMPSNYNFNGGQFGAVGDNATAADAHLTQDARQVNVVSPALLRELQELSERLTDASSDSEAGEIAELQKAITAGEAGDRNSMLSHLAQGGKWLLEKASDIGVKLAYEAIKQGLSM